MDPTEIVLVPEASTTVPLTVGTTEASWFTTVKGFRLVSTSEPAPVATVGVAALPKLLNAMLVRVLVPTRFSTPPLLMVSAVFGLICPSLVSIVTVAPVMVRLPAGITTVPAVPARLSTPCETVVPPVYVLVAESVSVPAPDFTSESAADPVPVTWFRSRMSELMVSVPPTFAT